MTYGSEPTTQAPEPPAFTPGIEDSGWGAEASEPDGWGDDTSFGPPPDPEPPVESAPHDPFGSQLPPASTPFDQSQSFSVSEPSPKSGMSTGAKIAIGIGLVLVLLLGLGVAATVMFVRAASDVIEEEAFDEVFDDFIVPDEIGATSLTLGDCFNANDGTTAVACDQPHDYEIFALKELDTSSYPTWEETWYETSCEDDFEAFAGIPYFDSALWYEVARPTQSLWDQGDHDIRCVIYIPDEQLIGTARGAGY